MDYKCIDIGLDHTVIVEADRINNIFVINGDSSGADMTQWKRGKQTDSLYGSKSEAVYNAINIIKQEFKDDSKS